MGMASDRFMGIMVERKSAPADSTIGNRIMGDSKCEWCELM